MAYSDKVIDRFESVLKDPKKHAVGRFCLLYTSPSPRDDR